MVIHLTKRLAEKLKLSPKTETAANGLFSWRAHYVQESGQRFVVFMNDASRFTVVINKATEAKLRKLPELFIDALRDTLLSLGVNPEVIKRYIADLGEVTYSKNADRKRTAQLNNNIKFIWWSLQDWSDNAEIAVYVNNVLTTLLSQDDYIKPKDTMLKLLATYGLPVRKCRAFDLNVRLDLDGKDAVRKLRVPAAFSFIQLHDLLQKAFGWSDYHYYCFGMFKNWDDVYSSIPDAELVENPKSHEANPYAIDIAGKKLSAYIPEYRKILYTYDFGEDWSHYIDVEAIIEDCSDSLPRLLSGEGDAPPEDAGGAGGFAEFLEIISDPAHEDHDEITDWARYQGWRPFDFDFTAYRINNDMEDIGRVAAAGEAPPLDGGIDINGKILTVKSGDKSDVSGILYSESGSTSGASHNVPGELGGTSDASHNVSGASGGTSGVSRNIRGELRRILDYVKTHPAQWGYVIADTPHGTCDNCGNPAKINIDDNQAHEIGTLCDDCYNRLMAALTGANILDITPKQISVSDNNGKSHDFVIDFYVFRTGKLLTATETGKLKRKADVFGKPEDEFMVMLDTLKQRIKKQLSVKYMNKDGRIAGDKAIGYIVYNGDRDECDIIVDGKPYTWSELETNISMREGWKIKIEFAGDGDELD